MISKYLEEHIELICDKVHQAWMEEKLKQGFHAPTKCLTFDIPDEVFYSQPRFKFEKHCDYCHTDLYPYNELPENIKDYDRGMVKAVIEAIKGIEDRG